VEKEHGEQFPQDSRLLTHGVQEVDQCCHLLGIHLLLQEELHQPEQGTSAENKNKDR